MLQTADGRAEKLAETNPLFGPAKLKLGIFCTNVSNGAAVSTMEGVHQLTWANTAHLTKLADEMKFETVFPIGRWRGFGGETDFNGEQFESMTFAAAVGATTTYPAAAATIHVPSIHPVMAAKQAATIDHISGGRFALNVVTGWNPDDLGIFGDDGMSHDERYIAAAEWLTIMKLLWTSDEPLFFEGKYYQVENALLRPQPIQPYPAIVSAASSPIGRNFAAEHADISFTILAERDAQSIRERVDSYKKPTYENFGRDMKVWINAYMIIGDTEEDAQRQFEHCVTETVDQVALDNFLSTLKVNATGVLPPEVFERIRQDMTAGWGGYRLQGTKEQIVDQMKVLSEAGIDGILLTWPAFAEGMERFQREVLPLMVEAGLR